MVSLWCKTMVNSLLIVLTIISTCPTHQVALAWMPTSLTISPFARLASTSKLFEPTSPTTIQQQSDHLTKIQLMTSINSNDNINRGEILLDSERRRQLLLSLLTTAGSTAMFGPRATWASDLSTATTATIAADPTNPLMQDKFWTNVNILKPPLDDRDYDAYILPNGLRVILCSDPTSNEAGAAMDVHVGACSDPLQVHGLAHFCEHMLFLGTEKYPNENSFENFLTTNGGSSNAYTDSENTVYYFTMEAEADSKLNEGLLRFGSFFIAPLFTETATGRELNAIDSEHAKNLQTDSFRMYQIEKGRQNTQHPHSKFFTGNRQTLLDDTKKAGLNLRNELIQFYNQYYSANQMTLAVVGPQSINKLKQMVQEAFGEVPNRNNVSAPETAWKYIVPPYNSDGTSSLIPSFGNVVQVVPVRDLRQISLTWPIIYKSDQDRFNAYWTKQSNYVAQMIGHEGPGSLLSYLKRQGWANSVTVGTESELSDYENFEIVVGLTTAGLQQVPKIVESIYSYLKMLQTKPIPDYILTEFLQLEELNWRFLTKAQVEGYVSSLATALQKYPPGLAIAGPRRLALSKNDDDSSLLASSEPRMKFDSKEQLEYTKKETLDFVNQLTVDNALMTVISKTFEGQTDQVEEWYGTQYSAKPIPESRLAQWKNCAKADSLGISFPKKNVFIPSEDGLAVKNPPIIKDRFAKRTFEDRMTPIPQPTIIRDDGVEGRWTVYFKEDDKFGQPKAFVIFQLLTKEVYATPMRAALAALYETCVTDKLEEYAYDAGLAGLTYDVKVLPRGVRLTFGGYNDKLQKFATYISKKVSSDIRDVLPTTDEEFDRLKDQNMRGLASFDTKQPYAHCASYSLLTMEPQQFLYSNSDLRAATAKATRADLIDYVATLWSSGKGIALVEGNLYQQEALDLVDTIDRTLGFTTIPKKDFPPELAPLPLPQVDAKAIPTKLVISEPNPSNSNSASYVVIQSLSKKPRDAVLMELISSIVAEPFYDFLRTKQQLGYIVSSGIRGVGKTRFLGFVAQSSVAPASKLTTEILKYLDNVGPKQLEKIQKGDFAIYVKSLIDRKTEPDKNLASQVTRNWAEIASGRLQFDRVQLEAAALLDLTKDDLVEFWNELYVKNGRRVLITEMIPRTGVASSAAPPKSTGYASGETNNNGGSGSANGLVLGIDDIEKFRVDRQAIKNNV